MKKDKLVITLFYIAIIAWLLFCFTSCRTVTTNQSCGSPTLRFNKFQKMPR